jgi:hypothetical protein
MVLFYDTTQGRFRDSGLVQRYFLGARVMAAFIGLEDWVRRLGSILVCVKYMYILTCHLSNGL